MDASWLVPDWPAPPNVRAVCTTREGGVSLGRYESLNLGDHVGDEPVHVAQNRNRLRAAVGARPVFLQQVHGTGVVELDAAAGAVNDGTAADGCTATEAGLACTIMVADCLPVLFTDEAGHRVAAAHAGWRGLAGGVLEQTAKSFDGASKVIAWLGPCIGPKAFEVGPEVKAAFEAHAPEAASCFRPAPAAGKWLADLPGLARQRLRAAGIESIHGNDGSDPWCTVGNASRFFSHRRDGISGRFAALVWKA
ncbi:peptidoglycan editing factor PgeF [Variovorax guangxiensis]|uniref:Purine nucleoside phosphorylase n=1 Tax=Variovorax guangxiensis TaxID=1775474 RepID=A0A433MCR6_9BURK|nr:peptidoglycan editing factor PgeF [Variovorax guangxiensis]RUR65656.1 peptidoglycan editing factor PgeF [Variovorax guangxiensis]